MLNFPLWLNDDAGVDLIRRLLVKSQTKRLGCLKSGAADVKNHQWFAKINFKLLLEGKVTPPIVPRMKDPLDTSNFYPIQDDHHIVKYHPTGKSFEAEWDKEF